MTLTLEQRQKILDNITLPGLLTIVRRAHDLCFRRGDIIDTEPQNRELAAVFDGTRLSQAWMHRCASHHWVVDIIVLADNHKWCRETHEVVAFDEQAAVAAAEDLYDCQVLVQSVREMTNDPTE
jgi:hypothetical protein